MFTDLFTETTAVLAIAAAIAILGAFLRQPPIIAYILAGVVVGPLGLDLVTADDPLDLLAQMGIAMLLFVVGLKLDPGLIRHLGRRVPILGLAQVVVTALLGVGLARMLGFDPLPSLYVALGLAFSSTVLIVKLLSDVGEIDALHGRIALGILILQDLVVVIVMILLTAFSGTGSGVPWSELLAIPLKGAAFLVAVGVAMRYLLPRLLQRLAHSRELLTLVATAWAVSLAVIGHWLGFSHEVGAFVAGVSLATTPFHDAIGARLTALRDFLLLFFFVDLATHMQVADLGSVLAPALALSAFALVVKPLLIFVLLTLSGYPHRTAGLTALTMGQISEFSLILAAMGLKLGHLDATTVGTLTLVALISIAVSSYLIGYTHRIYARLADWLKAFGAPAPAPGGSADAGGEPPDVLLFGLGRFGERIALGIKARGGQVLGVDFDPEAIRNSLRLGISARYGDAGDADFVMTLPLDGVPWVVSSVRETDLNRSLLYALRQHGYQGKVAVATHRDSEIESLVTAGADLVLRPYEDAADQAVNLVSGRAVRTLPLGIPPESPS